ncbi:hypothetical protein GCM10010145_39990 [Streptomyces ruber]|uniref:HTH merR-type domain-containing protein n=2 Tax=Streptomyces TaxID=1883 RepID=A0A918BG12_9ACTN|nr:hypothetical protein GCM10010145_39990 [Streptomyces ruber]
MTMLTIGAFARASRLSPKALRLYDELDLLRPARVDPDTGYRYYAAGQLERARLVAWLRRLGMPLARIRQVCALDGPAAAREIRAYWARAEAETAARRDLVAFLVDHLSDTSAPSEEDTAMLGLRYAAHSDTGLVRPANQDTAHAGTRVLAVADGFGSAGASASSAAVEALKVLDRETLPNGQRAESAGGGRAGRHPRRTGRRGHRGGRHDPHRHALDRLAARPRAHRRLARLPAARRRALPDHP